MIKVLLLILCLLVSSYAETFGEDVEGIWRIDAAKEDYNIEIAGGVGNRMALKFDKNGKVYKMNYETLKSSYPGADSPYSWEIIKDGIIHIAFANEKENIIGNFIFNSHFNNYLKIF